MQPVSHEGGVETLTDIGRPADPHVNSSRRSQGAKKWPLRVDPGAPWKVLAGFLPGLKEWAPLIAESTGGGDESTSIRVG